MAYARFSDDSDVYVYDTEFGGVQTIICDGAHSEHLNSSPLPCSAQQMIEHLKAHQAVGHKVPDYAFRYLGEKICRFIGCALSDEHLTGDCANL